MHVVLLVEVVTEGVKARGSSPRLAILRLVLLISHPVDALSRLHPYVLSTELFSAEVLHEVFAGDEAALFICVLQQYLIELLDNCLHHFFEASRHRFFFLSIRADVLAELLVNFLYDSSQPILHVLVSELHLLIHLYSLFVQLLSRLDLDMKLVDFGVGGALPRHVLSILILLIRVLHLELVQFLSDLFIFMAQPIKFFFVLAHSVQQL